MNAVSVSGFLFYILVSVWCIVGNKSLKTLPEARIIGGETAIPHEFPHHIILVAEDDEFFRTCGGSILSFYYILTAAHCVDNISAKDITVVAGKHVISAKENTTQRSKAAQVFVHPCYSSLSSNQINDIALLKLLSPLKLNKFVNSVPLDVNDRAKAEINATVIGWGRTDPTRRGSSSDVLKKATLEILGEDECGSVIRSFSPGSQICAIASDGHACNGDSGGALLCADSGRNYICGIASFVVQTDCVGAPSGYTRVSYFKTWLNDVIQNGRLSSANCAQSATRRPAATVSTSTTTATRISSCAFSILLKAPSVFNSFKIIFLFLGLLSYV